jgi:hypothetical protein
MTMSKRVILVVVAPYQVMVAVNSAFFSALIISKRFAHHPVMTLSLSFDSPTTKFTIWRVS